MQIHRYILDKIKVSVKYGLKKSTIFRSPWIFLYLSFTLKVLSNASLYGMSFFLFLN